MMGVLGGKLNSGIGGWAASGVGGWGEGLAGKAKSAAKDVEGDEEEGGMMAGVLGAVLTPDLRRLDGGGWVVI